MSAASFFLVTLTNFGVARRRSATAGLGRLARERTQGETIIDEAPSVTPVNRRFVMREIPCLWKQGRTAILPKFFPAMTLITRLNHGHFLSHLNREVEMSPSKYRTAVKTILLSILLSVNANAQRRSVIGDNGSIAAVVVKNRALIHTTQIFPVTQDDRTVVGARNASEQFDRVMQRLKTTLSSSGSSLRNLVKLNLYATSDDVAAVVRTKARKLWTKHGPAIALVVTPLTYPKALVAADAVATTTRHPESGIQRGTDRCVIAPGKGRLIYISGQAERGRNLADASRKTLLTLLRSLKFLKASPKHVVQVKTFLQPMKSVAQVDREINRLYSRQGRPPVSHIQWTYSQIEIELIAFVPYKAGGKRSREPVRFITPPWMKSSPVFSRIAVVESEELIYISGLYGRSGGAGDQQIQDIFGALKNAAAKTGSDLRHLVKATYYVSDKQSNRELNRLRPKFYDPKRPPAASKAGVASVGLPRRAIMIDMIAVPKR